MAKLGVCPSCKKVVGPEDLLDRAPGSLSIYHAACWAALEEDERTQLYESAMSAWRAHCARLQASREAAADTLPGDVRCVVYRTDWYAHRHSSTPTRLESVEGVDDPDHWAHYRSRCSEHLSCYAMWTLADWRVVRREEREEEGE